MNINVIGMPLFYGCDKPGVEKGPDTLRVNNINAILSKNHIVNDLGNIEVLDIDPKNKFDSNSKMKYLDQVIDANEKLADVVFKTLENGNFPLTIGGDHALALGSLAGVSKHFKDDFAVVWVDAHGDINTPETTPSGNVHGMPLSGSMGVGPKELTSISFDGVKVKPENVFIIACRDLDPGEVDLINNLNINVWNMSDIKDKGVEAVSAEVFEKLQNGSFKNIHLSYDIDCLDPEYVPGTGTPVSDGLNFEESAVILKTIFSTSSVKSMDFVEYNPDLDINEKTLETCLELFKIISNELK